jgi:hypothetical protein
MKKVNNIWVGRLEGSISLLIKNLPDLLTRFQYVLISSVDSSRDLRTLKKLTRIIQEFKDSQFDNGALLMRIDDLFKTIAVYNLFNGFDEMWLFPSLPLKKFPHELWITGPLDLCQEVPEELGEWMMFSSCILGLGDGIGLNYITTDNAIAKLLETTFGVK